MQKEQDRDLKKLASELLEWSKKKDSLNLCAFCCDREDPFPPRYLPAWAKTNEDIRFAYDIAKGSIAANRELKLATKELHIKAYDLNARTYDYFMDQKQKRITDHEAKARAKAAAAEAKANLSDPIEKWTEKPSESE